MRVSDFDFDLPPDLIALRPAVPRDSARLLVIHEGASDFIETTMREFPTLLNHGDLCIFNDTRVINARLFGARLARGSSSDARIEVTLHKRESASRWLAFAKPGRKLDQGDTVSFAGALAATVFSKKASGEIGLEFNCDGAVLDQAIAAYGVMPLPPYIAAKRPADARDHDDYQTIFASREGAVAAPTAGLHFTPALMSALARRGIMQAQVTLHVGAGTFLPVKAEDTGDHVMHAEWGSVPAETVDMVRAARKEGRRVACIGTTSLRTIETASKPNLESWSGDTSIFITPGYEFKTVDMLLTNFHLPKSTLFMLVSAFCGLKTMRAAYAYAIERHFRFYSYGDACLLIRDKR